MAGMSICILYPRELARSSRARIASVLVSASFPILSFPFSPLFVFFRFLSLLHSFSLTLCREQREREVTALRDRRVLSFLSPFRVVRSLCRGVV